MTKPFLCIFYSVQGDLTITRYPRCQFLWSLFWEWSITCPAFSDCGQNNVNVYKQTWWTRVASRTLGATVWLVLCNPSHPLPPHFTAPSPYLSSPHRLRCNYTLARTPHHPPLCSPEMAWYIYHIFKRRTLTICA